MFCHIMRSAPRRILFGLSAMQSRSSLGCPAALLRFKSERTDLRLNNFSKSHHEMDILEEGFVNARNVSDIFQSISIHQGSLNEDHVARAFSVLARKARDDEQLKSEIVSDHGFKILCSKSMQLVKFMPPSKMINILWDLYHLKVPHSTRIVQTFIHSVRRRLNEFDIHQMVTLRLLLQNMDSTEKSPLNQAIMLAIPILVEMKIKAKELPFYNKKQAMAALQFACYREMSMESIHILMKILEQYLGEMTSAELIKVLSALLIQEVNSAVEYDGPNQDVAYMSYVGDILNRLSKQELSPNDIASILYNLQPLVSRGWWPYLSHSFMERISKEHQNRIMDTKMDYLKNNMWFFFKHSYMSDEHLEVLSKRLLNEQEPSSAELLIWLEILTHRSEWNPSCGWSSLIDHLVNKDQLSSSQPKELLTLMGYIASLDYFPFYIFRHLEGLLKIWNKLSLKRILHINASIALSKTIGEEDRHIYLQQLRPIIGECIQGADPILKEQYNSSILSKTLARALGGEDFVKTRIWTREGLFLPNVIALRKGDYPIAMRPSTSKFSPEMIEDLQLPEESKLVVVSEISNLDVCRLPPNGFRRFASQRFDMMRQKGFHVVPINIDELEKMSPRDHIPFIMKKISETVGQ